MIENLIGILIYSILFIGILAFVALFAIVFMVWIQDLKLKREMKKEMKKWRGEK